MMFKKEDVIYIGILACVLIVYQFFMLYDIQRDIWKVQKGVQEVKLQQQRIELFVDMKLQEEYHAKP